MSLVSTRSSASRLLGALAIACVLGAASLGCDSNSNLINGGGNGGGGGGQGSGTMTATVGGVAWAADEVQATLADGVLGMGGAMFPGGSANKQINLTIPSAAVGMGTFTLPNIAIYTDATGPNIEDISSYQSFSGGSYNIETLTSSGASGTFSFTGTQTLPMGEMGSVVVTNGTFDVTF